MRDTQGTDVTIASHPGDGDHTQIQLVGREPERRRIAAALAGARKGRASALVVTGEPGIGKTRLLDHAGQLGSDLLVCQTRGVLADFQLPYSGLRDILANLTLWLACLPPPQAEALGGIMTIGSPGSVDRFAVAASFLNLIAAAAEDDALLVLVDDAHWVDDASLEALGFAARRLRGERVLMLFATRTNPATASGVVEAQLASLQTLTLRGFGYQEARELFDWLGRPKLGEAALEELLQGTGGNPLALIEMSSTRPAFDWSGPIAVGPRLASAFGERIAFLTATTRAALLVLACAATADSDAVLKSLAALSLDTSHLRDAEAAGLVVVRAGELSFTHPLVRSAVYQSAAPPERRAAHRALADALAGKSHPLAKERRCLHLAMAAEGFDDEIANELDVLATDAVTRGAYATALQAFEQSALLSADPEQRGRRMLQAAELTQLAGRVDRAERLLDQADACVTSRRLRSEVAHVRWRIEMWNGHPVAARNRLLQLAQSIAELEPLQAAYMLAHAGLLSAYLGEHRSAAGILEQANGLLADVPGALPAELERDITTVSATPIVLLVTAVVEAIGGRGDSARALLAQVRRWLDTWDPLSPGSMVLVGALSYFSVEDIEASRRLFDRAEQAARAANALGLLPFQLSWRAYFEWWCGSWQNAYGIAHESLSLARETGWATEVPHALSVTALLEAVMGREACRQHAAEAVELATATGAAVVRLQADYALALLELFRDPLSAANRLERVGDFARSNGMGDPVLLPWAADFAEACVRSGDPGRADLAIEVIGSEAVNSGRPTEQALSYRVAAMVGDTDDAERDLLTALEWHGRTRNPFETARTQLALGEHLRRRKRKADARAQLREALLAFERLGATEWANRARAELTATGDREQPRSESRIAQLTPQEMQVALCVREGASNSEIGAQLFLSSKTVEYHLTHVYRKLNLRSRAQLSRALADLPSST